MNKPSGYMVVDHRTVMPSHYGPFLTLEAAKAWATEHIPNFTVDEVIALWDPAFTSPIDNTIHWVVVTTLGEANALAVRDILLKQHDKLALVAKEPPSEVTRWLHDNFRRERAK